jgi:hypothetical protein
VSEQPPPQLPPDGQFPGWAALVGVLVFPPIGLFMVSLTTWNTRSTVLVGIGVSVLWVVAVGLVIFLHRGGPTGA